MSAILVTGINGQIGFELGRIFGVSGEVRMLTRSQMDLADEASILGALRTYRPKIIVNSAAYTAVDHAESNRDQAMAVNAVAPGIMARYAADHDAMIIHYSTDYVFDGKKTSPYTEDDQVNPQSVYGETKWLGEEAIRASGVRHLILRTSWVYGLHGENFPKAILRLARERSSLSVVADQVGAPTSAAMVADATKMMVERAADGLSDCKLGTYHVAAEGSTSWYRYAEHIIRLATSKNFELLVTFDKLIPISTAEYPSRAKRPANSQLDCSKLRHNFGLSLPSWELSVNEFISELVSS
ncbi:MULTISPECIES: dTDP-4-dehydrorhamnose reductase [unclassified Rhizobium]|uniref:dTDP-4-dehydrorhamnose reductase n=1 Tax=unclassified Rhizobium TaxID=2613769 RepID=UPI00380CF262